MAVAAGSAMANNYAPAVIAMTGGPSVWTTPFGTSHSDGLPFVDTYTFSYSGLPGSAQGYFANITNVSASPTSVLNFSWADINGVPLTVYNGVPIPFIGGTASGSVFFSVPVSGLVKLTIIGTDTGTASYAGTLDITSAVPEPATYGMLLGGLALMGWMARRRKS
ncbi:PEP-CTERM sorting domain-containing protein [Duganella sp. BJB475]|nr:PEP-CTERM sorting domain-containing protein [Duganella sp. BJB475]RFP22624.1 PEP-CTERM sorting domain-containing protein [Duganella sp. BJB476]